MNIEELKKELSNVFIDFGNGFRFSVEDVIKENHDIYGESIILKIHPGSIRWIEIEYKLKQKDFSEYNSFIAECYEAEDEFWKELFEDRVAEDAINELKENF